MTSHIPSRTGPVLVVSLASALQRTLIMSGLKPGAVNRARKCLVSQGGKACNTARVLHQLGRDTLMLGFSGGATGKELEACLDACGVAQRYIPVAEPTRVCTTVLDPDAGTHTELVEEAVWPGPAAFDALMELVRQQASTASAAVLAGALPPGAPADTYARIIRELHAHDVPVFIDTSGEAYRLARRERPLFVKLNRHEQEATGPVDAVAFGREAIEGGIAWLLVTNGRHPARLYGRDGAVDLTPPRVVEVSALGSGDATTAGLVDAWLRGNSMEEAVRFGMRCGAANARTLIPGELDWTGQEPSVNSRA